MNKAKSFLTNHYRPILAALFLGAALINWKYLFYVIAVLELAQVFLGRVYCGFICPSGILQSGFAQIGRRLFHRKFGKFIPRRLHELLSHLRYINIVVLLFFGASVIGDVFSSIYAPDVNFLLNKQGLNYVAIGWLLFWLVAGLFVERPYCKYVCGGSCLAGAFSHVRLYKIVRNPKVCINCKRCEKICPMLVPITELETVESHNCISCYKCLDRGICPKQGALTFKWRGGKKSKRGSAYD